MIFSISRLFGAIFLILAVSSCGMLGPKFKKPCPNISCVWDIGDSEKLNQDPGRDCQWWKILDDPLLNDLVAIGYNQNLTLQTAGIRVMEARAILGIAVGELYPQEQLLGADFTTFRASPPTPDRYFNELSVGFDAVWELDLWGKYRRGVQAAGSNLVASIASYDDVMVAIIAEVSRTYVLIRSFEERILLATKNASIQARVVELTRILFEGGTESELDTLQAASVLHNTEALIPRLETSLNQAINALSVLLNIPSLTLREILDRPGTIPTAPPEIAIGLPAELLRRRPDIRQAEYQALAQCALIGIAESELYPSFSLIGSIGWTGTDAGTATIGNLFNSNNYRYDFGPSIRWNLFNYGRLKNQVRVEDARYEELLTDYQNTVINAVGEVQDAAIAYVKSHEETESLRKSVEAAERSLEISIEQYIEGLATYQRVLDTTRTLTNQQDQYVQAATDIITNLIAVYKALGGGWETRCTREFIPRPVKYRMKCRTDWGHLLDCHDEVKAGCHSITSPIRAPDW
ncbi:MAG: efflux transporter outer membrane subunit [Chlamydiota bacterium]